MITALAAYTVDVSPRRVTVSAGQEFKMVCEVPAYRPGVRCRFYTPYNESFGFRGPYLDPPPPGTVQE